MPKLVTVSENRNPPPQPLYRNLRALSRWQWDNHSEILISIIYSHTRYIRDTAICPPERFVAGASSYMCIHKSTFRLCAPLPTQPKCYLHIVVSIRVCGTAPSAIYASVRVSKFMYEREKERGRKSWVASMPGSMKFLTSHGIALGLFLSDMLLCTRAFLYVLTIRVESHRCRFRCRSSVIRFDILTWILWSFGETYVPHNHHSEMSEMRVQTADLKWICIYNLDDTARYRRKHAEERTWGGQIFDEYSIDWFENRSPTFGRSSVETHGDVHCGETNQRSKNSIFKPRGTYSLSVWRHFPSKTRDLEAGSDVSPRDITIARRQDS